MRLKVCMNKLNHSFINLNSNTTKKTTRASSGLMVDFWTHRPRKAERQHNPGFVTLVQRKCIPTEHGCWGSAETAGPGRGHLQLVLLQAHPEVGVTLVCRAASIPSVSGAVAAGAALQPPVDILHRHNLKLKVSRSWRNLQRRTGESPTGSETNKRDSPNEETLWRQFGGHTALTVHNMFL